MPPKPATGKTYSADVVAALLYATGTTSLSMKNYELMSAIDGVKTASAFQHDFRDVLAGAKNLKARIESGETFKPVQPSNRRDPSRTMAKAGDAATSNQKEIPVDCVAVLLMALGLTSISKKQLDMMSALDGTRTSSSFEHQFRPIIALSKELKKRVDADEDFKPVVPQKRGPSTPASSKKRKGDDACDTLTKKRKEDQSEDTPTKKAKAPVKARAKKGQPASATAPTVHPEDDDDELPDDMADFIKAEKKWEEEQYI